ncbi:MULTISPECIES: MepB family protein [unclassified Streptomyces]|uniref:MepB family protein n=1 Tax=Streptomyces sp. Ag109_G2-15 TaxID=1938850 RepID=UPI000BE4366D
MECERARSVLGAFRLGHRQRASETTGGVHQRLKVGQFVTVWQRSEKGPIRPFDADDHVDLFVISSRHKDGFGQFVFPGEVLCEHGIVSRDASGGKRGFRVYPPWVTTTSRQARTTQAWQVNYFLHLGQDGPADLTRAHALYRPYPHQRHGGTDGVHP